MLRNYRIYKVGFEMTKRMMKPDPPGSGEMSCVGTHRENETAHVLAASADKAMAWVAGRYNSWGTVDDIKVLEEYELDAFLMELTH